VVPPDSPNANPMVLFCPYFPELFSVEETFLDLSLRHNYR
jgi:hypothetical protein